MFCQFNNKIININYIKSIDCEYFLSKGYVTVNYSEDLEFVEGAEALQLIMNLYPSVLEGKRGRYWKFQWAAHNLIGHPLMQIFSCLGLRKWAMWMHEVTVPRPKLPIKM